MGRKQTSAWLLLRAMQLASCRRLMSDKYHLIDLVIGAAVGWWAFDNGYSRGGAILMGVLAVGAWIGASYLFERRRAKATEEDA